MKTIEELKKETFRSMCENAVIAHNSDNEHWVSELIQIGVEFAQRWNPVSEELPEIKEESYSIFVIRQYQTKRIAKYDCFEIGEFIPKQYSSMENYFKYWNITHWRKIELI